MDAYTFAGLRLIWLVALTLVVATLGVAHATAGTITVTSTADSGAGTLRQAIADASPGDTINFSVTGTITLSSQLAIAKNLTISGPGADQLALNGNNSVRIIDISSSSTVSISGLTLIDGDGSPGGAMRALSSTVTLNGVAVLNSTSTVNGGGIASSSTLTINNSVISNNDAASFGGGISIISGGTTTVTNSTITGNTAGGGSAGGGIQNSATLELINSTVAGNDASGTGGGVNGSFTATNTILADNTAGSSGPNCNGTLTGIGGGSNLVESTSSCTLAGVTTGNITGQDPGLGSLQDNGGATETMSIVLASPALNAGTATSCPSTDQRGITRPQGAACDIGAFEVSAPQNTVAPTVAGSPAPGQALSCATGTWANTVASYSYQWNRNGSAITGETNSNLTLGSSDEGTTITCTVTATSAVGSVGATSEGLFVPYEPGPVPDPFGLSDVRLSSACSRPTLWLARAASNNNLSLSYRLSHDATVKATLTRSKSKGLNRLKRCPNKKALSRYQRSKRYKRVKSLTQAGKSGSNTLSLATKKRGSKKQGRLQPGFYKVEIGASKGGDSIGTELWLTVLAK